MNRVEKKLNRGLFIVIEGIDGTGKTTFAKGVSKALDAKGGKATYTFEPTQGKFGAELRKSFLAPERLSPEKELELFNLDRREHVKDVIIPSINKGITVVCDRYFYSTMAYQGARGLDPYIIRRINLEFAPEPDILFMLSLEPEKALNRIIAGRGDEPDNFEQLSYLKKVDAIFKTIDHPYKKLIDAEDPPDKMVFKALSMLNEKLTC